MVADIARILREKPPGNRTIREVLEYIARIIPLDSCTLYLVDKKSDRLEEVAGCGQAVNPLDFVRFSGGMGLTGWVARQKRPIVIPGRDPVSDQVREHHDSVMILPLMVLGDLIGLLCCRCRQRQAFDNNRRKLLEIVADQVAISMERIIHQQELEARNRSLRKAREELVKAQEKLIAQEKLKAVGELAVSVNHEVNNPLAIIVGNAQIIELEAANLPEKFTHRIRAIVDGAKRISMITHKLLKIDRLVSENYLSDDRLKMLNIHKSAGEQS